MQRQFKKLGFGASFSSASRHHFRSIIRLMQVWGLGTEPLHALRGATKSTRVILQTPEPTSRDETLHQKGEQPSNEKGMSKVWESETLCAKRCAGVERIVASLRKTVLQSIASGGKHYQTFCSKTCRPRSLPDLHDACEEPSSFSNYIFHYTFHNWD